MNLENIFKTLQSTQSSNGLFLLGVGLWHPLPSQIELIEPPWSWSSVGHTGIVLYCTILYHTVPYYGLDQYIPLVEVNQAIVKLGVQE